MAADLKIASLSMIERSEGAAIKRAHQHAVGIDEPRQSEFLDKLNTAARRALRKQKHIERLRDREADFDPDFD